MMGSYGLRFLLRAAFPVLIAGTVNAAAVYETDFESSGDPSGVNYALSNLHGQDGWSVDAGTADVVDTPLAAGSGSNYVTLGSDTILSRGISSPGQTRILMRGYYYGGGSDTLEPPDDSQPMAAILGFRKIDSSTFAIAAFDGGATQFTEPNPVIAFSSNAWHKIVISLDYTTKTFDVAVDDQPHLQDVAFRDNSLTQLNGLEIFNKDASNVDTLGFFASNGDYDNDGVPDDVELVTPGRDPLTPDNPQPEIAVLTPWGEMWGVELLEGGGISAPSLWTQLGYQHNADTGWQTLTLDWSGDGLNDVATVTDLGQLWIAENNGSKQFVNNHQTASGYIFDEPNAPGWISFAGDINNDDKSDLVLVTELGDVWTGLSDGSSITDPIFARTLNFVWNPSAGFWIGLADVDGDGNDDLVQITNIGEAWVALGDGVGAFIDPTKFGQLGFLYDRAIGWAPHLGDFNGDQMADLVEVTPYGDVWVSLSTGTSYATQTRWAELGFKDQPDLNGGWNVFIADLNGDGKDDLLQLTEYTDLWQAISTGTGFDTPSRLDFTGFYHHPRGSWQLFVDDFVTN